MEQARSEDQAERFSTTNLNEAAALWAAGFVTSHTTQHGRTVRFHFVQDDTIWETVETYRRGALRVDPDMLISGYRQFLRVAQTLKEMAR
jgi:hypothetical protein